MKSLYKTMFLIFFLFVAFVVAGGSKAYAAPPTCTLSAASIIFPPYDSSVVVTATGNLMITCSVGNPTYTVSLGPSSGSGLVNPRALKRTTSPFDMLTYTITTPATAQGTPAGALWGDGTSGTIVVIEKYKPLVPLVMTGTIPAGQDMTYGSYTDNITATVTP